MLESRSLLVICFKYSSVYMSVPNSTTAALHPSPTVAASESLFYLPCVSRTEHNFMCLVTSLTRGKVYRVS